MALAALLGGCGSKEERGSKPEASGPNGAAAKPGANAAADPAAPVAPIVVLAAASTADALGEIAKLFEEQSGVSVKLSAGPSNALAQQILAGAPADVFVSASEKWAKEVRTKGVATTRLPLLANELVLVVPKTNPAGISSPADLTSEAVHHVALGGENVPAGTYGEQALRSLKLYEPLEESKKIVRGHDVRVTLSYVERGEAEAGIVYATDARASSEVEVVHTFAAADHDPIIYPAVLIQHEQAHAAGGKFFEFLFSDAATEIFRRHGFSKPPAKPSAESPAKKGE